MAETKFDPTKVFIGTRLYKDTDERGSVIIDENTNDWKNGELVIELFDLKTGRNIGTHKERTTKNKYAVWQEDFTSMTKEDLIEKYFSDIKVGEPSEPALEKAARESELSTKEADLEKALARIADLEKEADARNEIDNGAFEAQVEPEEVGTVEEKPKKTAKKSK